MPDSSLEHALLKKIYDLTKSAGEISSVDFKPDIDVSVAFQMALRSIVNNGWVIERPNGNVSYFSISRQGIAYCQGLGWP